MQAVQTYVQVWEGHRLYSWKGQRYIAQQRSSRKCRVCIKCSPNKATGRRTPRCGPQPPIAPAVASSAPRASPPEV